MKIPFSPRPGGRYLAFKDSITDIVTQPLGRGADPSFAGNDLELLQNERYEDREGRGYKVERGVRPVSAILNTVSHLWHRHGLSGCMGDPARPVQRQTTRLHAKLLVCDPGRLDLWTLRVAKRVLIALGVAGRASDAPAAESDNSPLLEPAT